MYTLYSKEYIDHSEDDISKSIIKLILAEVENIVYGINLSIIPTNKKIRVSYNPSKPVDANIIKTFADNYSKLPTKKK